ncbi:MAG TPA: alpha/beta hydrolase [Microbacterium sp.]|nr:alpha/beta hydrolase [Microbacterium sp.]
MSSTFGTLSKARLMSSFVTRLIKAPSVSLTSRAVPDREVVQVPTRHGSVRCYVTRPAAGAPLAAGDTAPPVVINFHGGGFIIGNPLQDDHLVRGIAGEVGSVVINVDYSVSPRVRFPHALEQGFDVLEWVASSGPGMGWDGGRIALSGASAGGNLALGVLTLAGRENGPVVRTAVLIVPAVDQTLTPDQLESPLEKPFVNAGLLKMVDVAYLDEETDREDPLVSPAFLGDELNAFPPLLVFTAEYDTFRPFIDSFVDDARTRGVTVDQRMFVAVDHGFYYDRSTPEPVLRSLMASIRDHLLTQLR